MTLSKAIRQLARRRDHLKARLENGKGSEKSAGYDRTEISALEFSLKILMGLKEHRDRG